MSDAPTAPDAPPKFTIDELLYLLMELAHEEEMQFNLYGAEWRKRRHRILDRVILMIDVRKPQITSELRHAAKILDGGR